MEKKMEIKRKKMEELNQKESTSIYGGTGSVKFIYENGKLVGVIINK